MTLASAHEVNVFSTCSLLVADAEVGSSIRHGTLCVYIDLSNLDGLRARLLQVYKGQLALP